MPVTYWNDYRHCAACEKTPHGRLHCHRCGQDKYPDEFYEDRRRGRGAYHAGCKECRRAQARAQSEAAYRRRVAA